MRLVSGKRYVISDGNIDQENTPPKNRHRTKKSKLKQSTEDDSTILTPKTQNSLTSTPIGASGIRTQDPPPSIPRTVLSPRSSLSNCTTTVPHAPLRGRKSAVDFHGIAPLSPLSTLLISDPKPSPCGSLQSRNSVSSYFSHRKRRGKRSERRFHDLLLPKLTQDEFNTSCSEDVTLDDHYVTDVFTQWQMQINIGKNVLVYGFGSKLEILERFGLSEHCKDGSVLSVYAFKDPTVREVILQCAELILEQDLKKESNHEIIDQIQSSKRKLYLLVHNIDAVGMRKKQEQSLLAKLANCENVVMLASVENVNGCRLWDVQTCADFNWSMSAVHTCQNYFQEARNRPLILNPKTGGKKEDGDPVKAALLVLKSLVQNAQQMFILLANHKLSALATKSPAKVKNGCTLTTSTGLTFDGLYHRCKERFLASNPSTVRNHLKEFIAHDMIQFQRNELGAEEYTVCLEKTILETVIKELTKK